MFEAPCEAEATCAAMCKAGLVHGAATEDMDTLTFACPRLIRNLMAPASQKKDIAEYDFDKVLKGLDLDYYQFIDLCILCGCDYTDSIRGIGPVTALQLIREYKNIETILENIKDKKYVVPENFMYKEARQLFKEPEVIDTNNLELKWSKPNEEGVIEFLVKEKSFNEERVRNALARIKKAKAGVASQNRLESFFGAATVKSSTIGKRKELEKKKGSKGVVGGFKKSKGVGGFSKQRRTNIQILERSISQEVRILCRFFIKALRPHKNKMFRCVAPSFSSCVPPTPSSSSSPPRRAYDHQNHPIILRQFIVASAALTIASFGNVQKVEAGNPSFSGVDPEKSELIQNLLAKTKEDINPCWTRKD